MIMDGMHKKERLKVAKKVKAVKAASVKKVAAKAKTKSAKSLE